MNYIFFITAINKKQIFFFLFMDKCLRCEKSGREVKLLDAIYENDFVKICERCSFLEEIPIIRKPSTSQLKEAERGQSVSERLRRLSGMQEKKEGPKSILDQIRKLDENPELEKPEEKTPFNLIDNFNWHVQRARRNKGLSHKQLGWALGESETAVKMVESGDLPEGPEKLIRKLEQFLQIKLRERTEEELDEERRKLENKKKFKIPTAEEPKFEDIPIEPIISEEDIERDDILFTEKNNSMENGLEVESTLKERRDPVKVLTFKPEVMKGITISDLQRLKEEKEKEERLEMVERDRKMKLAGEMTVGESIEKEKKKQELKERVAEEMKDIALGKVKNETIEEKRKMLNEAISKVGKTEEERKKEAKVPTVYELMERRKDKVYEVKEKAGVPSISELAQKKQGDGLEKREGGEGDAKKFSAPTISELVDKKKQKEESILGDDIEIIE